MNIELFDKLITDGYCTEDALLGSCDCTTVSVCGSYEKSTCACLLREIYKAMGYCVYLYDPEKTHNVHEELQAQEKIDIMIIKLSYESLKNGLHSNAHYSIITNIVPYPIEKGLTYNDVIRIFAQSYIYQKKNDYLILNNDYHFLHTILPEIPGTLLEFSTRKKIPNGIGMQNEKIYYYDNYEADKIIQMSDLIFQGVRKKEAYLSAITAVYPLFNKNDICKVLREFRGAPDHYELVRELFSVRYFNNAASYLPSHTVQSMQAYTSKIILITGGDLTDLSYSSLAMEIIAFIKVLIVYGESADILISETKKAAFYNPKEIRIYKVESIQQAVIQARQSSVSNDTVVFSPCGGNGSGASIAASGLIFRQSVNELE